MPLSEHEQRLLEQMERALYADDPKFASSLRGSAGSGYNRRRLVLGIVTAVVGIGLLLGGVMQPLIPLGVAGFLLMLTGAWLSLTGWRARPGPATDSATSAKSGKSKPRHGFMNRMEDRWQRRQDGEQER